MTRRLFFQAFESSWWLVGSLVTVLVVAVLLIRLLQYERQLIPARPGYWLLGLRVCVITILALALAEPVLSWSLDRTRSGRIVVVVDVSDSMTITDAHASAAEKIRWARGLRLMGNSTIDQRLDDWVASLEAGREPEWVSADETSDPQRRKRLATIRQQNLQAILGSMDTLSRRQVVSKLLQDSPRPLLPELEAVGTVELRFFGGTVQPGELATLTGQVPESLQSDQTDLSAALQGVGHTEEFPVAGIVLFSDGRQTTQADPLSVATELGTQSVPVFPVAVGSRRSPRDLAIASIDAPRTVFLDDQPRITARVRTGGYRNQPVEIQLFPEDDPDDVTTRTIEPRSNSQDVIFQLSAKRLGRQRYVVRTEPRPDELRDDNNQRSFTINIVDDVAKVLLIEGEARWEFRFIDNALTRDERTEIQRVVFAQPFLGLQDQPYFQNRLEIPTGKDALQRSLLADTDLVIIGDAGPAGLGEDAWKLLETFVAETGGTLVLVAGKHNLPLGHRSKTLGQLLPVTDLVPLETPGDAGRAAPTERGFQVELTPEGQQEPMLQFHVESEENRRIWDGLAGHLWGLVGTARPGTTVLAKARLRADNEQPALERERALALFVRQYYGLGQVLWLGIDSTWRWRHRVGDTYHHRFWGQLARWAARNKSVSSNESVRLGVEAAEVSANEAVVVTARWQRGVLRRHGQLEARAEIYHTDAAAGDPPQAVLLVPLADRPLLWQGRTTALPPGDYQVRLAVSGAEIATDDVTADVYVHPPRSGELTDLSADPEHLADIARASGGELISVDQLDRLPDQLQRSTHLAALTGDIPLWNHWGILVLLFTFMTAEWVVRKVHGLP